MKKVSIALLFLLIAGYIKSQDPIFLKDDKVLNMTVGFGSVLYSGSYYSTSVPPLAISFEKGFKEDIIDVGSIGIGGYLGYSANKWEYNWLGESWGYKYSNLMIGARGSFHYPFLEKLDTYTGLVIGADIVTSKTFGNVDPLFNYSASGSGLLWAWFAGGRYYFNDQLAGLLELGYGIAYFNIGIAYKLSYKIF